ncbi:hypothetical protein COOONC_23466 [Cooperia oncophora]
MADDFLRAENESLRARVTELEKTVDRQQSELMLLQTTSADLLRRMAKLEISSSATNSGFAGTNSARALQKTASRLPPRNISQSSYNIAKTGSPSRNGLSRSLYIPCSQDVDDSPRSHITPASLKSEMVNVSIGKSSRGITKLLYLRKI